jgi:hypothetical protein
MPGASEPIVLGEKLLSLLDESSTSSTYKPALLLAIIDRSPEFPDGVIPVSSLAERVIELYWPQTLYYPTTRRVLSQNQGRPAKIVAAIGKFRKTTRARGRTLSPASRSEDDPRWLKLRRDVERSLAEMPIPRLQRPFELFLYDFDWPWYGDGGWSVRKYEAAGRGGSGPAIRLKPGVASALTSLGPLLRPFITRWWADKAASLNKGIEDAQSLIAFEQFLFGQDRVVLKRIGEGLLDIQAGRCGYCDLRIAKDREIDHFIPFSQSGDDGLFNLVAACRKCNGSKSATLAGPDFVLGVLERNERWSGDLLSLGEEREWPVDRERSARIATASYLLAPDEKPLWMGARPETRFELLGGHRSQLQALLAE